MVKVCPKYDWFHVFPDTAGVCVGKDEKTSENADEGGSSSTIIIVLVIVVLLVAVGVTVFAQKKKILCFKPAPGSGDEKDPLVKGGEATSKGSPSRITSGTSIQKSHQSRSNVSGE